MFAHSAENAIYLLSAGGRRTCFDNVKEVDVAHAFRIVERIRHGWCLRKSQAPEARRLRTACYCTVSVTVVLWLRLPEVSVTCSV